MTVTALFQWLMLLRPLAQTVQEQAARFGPIAQLIATVAVAIVTVLGGTVWYLQQRIVEKDNTIKELNQQFRQSERNQLETLQQISTYLEQQAAEQERHADFLQDHEESLKEHDNRVRDLHQTVASEMQSIHQHLQTLGD